MNCCFCLKPVLHGMPITAPGNGPAHQSCYNRYLVEQRVFGSLNLRRLSDHELGELHELVTMERNARQRQNHSVDLWD